MGSKELTEPPSEDNSTILGKKLSSERLMRFDLPSCARYKVAYADDGKVVVVTGLPWELGRPLQGFCRRWRQAWCCFLAMPDGLRLRGSGSGTPSIRSRSLAMFAIAKTSIALWRLRLSLPARGCVGE